MVVPRERELVLSPVVYGVARADPARPVRLSAGGGREADEARIALVLVEGALEANAEEAEAVAKEQGGSPPGPRAVLVRTTPFRGSWEATFPREE